MAKFGQSELDSYENSLKTYRDLKNVIDTAYDEGKIEGKMEGILEGKIAIAQAAKRMGLSTSDIMQLTGLSAKEIDGL